MQAFGFLWHFFLSILNIYIFDFESRQQGSSSQSEQSVVFVSTQISLEMDLSSDSSLESHVLLQWSILKDSCLSYFLLSEIKYHDKCNIIEEKVYLAYSYRRMQSAMVGDTGQQAGKAQWAESEAHVGLDPWKQRVNGKWGQATKF